MIGAVPDHEPGDAVRVCPTCAVPLIVGGAVFAGADGAACTTVVSALDADAEPTEFAAVTTTRSVAPTSACTGAYDWPVAPEISEQLPPEQRRHW